MFLILIITFRLHLYVFRINRETKEGWKSFPMKVTGELIVSVM